LRRIEKYIGKIFETGKISKSNQTVQLSTKTTFKKIVEDTFDEVHFCPECFIELAPKSLRWISKYSLKCQSKELGFKILTLS